MNRGFNSDDRENLLLEIEKLNKELSELKSRHGQKTQLSKLSRLKESLLRQETLSEKLHRITEAVLDIFNADFARVWIIKRGDRCDSGCIHANVKKGPHVCTDRDKCLHLVASSGRYRHLDGEIHSRVPFGCYKIGRVAAAQDPGFLTNEVTTDPRVHNHEWARRLGLVSFAGYRLLASSGDPVGVLALFSKSAISPEEATLLETLAATTGQVVQAAQGEEEVRRLRNLLKNIVDSMPSILIGVDPSGLITQWNKEAEIVTGIGARSAEGRHIGEVFPMLKGSMKRIVDVIRQRRTSRNERVAKVIDGESHYFDITFFPLIANGVDGAVIRLDDVTERVRIEEMIIQTEKMRTVGGLAAGMAHEINNPLAGILQNAQLLKSRLKQGGKRNEQAAESIGITMSDIENYCEKRGLVEIIDSIVDAGFRAARIVSDMLGFSRKSEQEFTTCDIASLLDSTIELAASDYDLATRYDFRKITIVREYEPVPLVQCQKQKIQQVFLNLLINGAQAMNENCGSGNAPCFHLRVFREGEVVCIEFEDNGSGMSEACMARAFDPFFTTKAVGLGTGLGLSISYFIVNDHHGGTMSVSSEPGKGSSFTVRLPIKHK